MVKRILSFYISVYLAMLGFLPVRSARAQEKKIYTIGILNLAAKGVSEVEAEVLSEKLRSHVTQLLQSPEYRAMADRDQYEVVEREDMDKIFEQFDIQNIGCVSDSCAIEFGKMLQADRILQGTIGKVGNTYSVSARILDVESTKTIANRNIQYRGSIDDVLTITIPELGNALFLGETKKKSKKMWYILGGLLIAGGGAAAVLMGGDGGGGSGSTPLPMPPPRP